MRRLHLMVFAAFAALSLAPAHTADMPEIRLAIENHRFTPAEIRVPTGQKVKLIVENRDATPEEFESYELNREKVVLGNASITVFVGPLEKGRYKFFGDFHQDSAQGALIVD